MLTVFHREIMRELKAVDVNSIEGPAWPIRESDEFLGVMSVNLKRVYALREKTLKQFRALRSRILHYIADLDEPPANDPAFERMEEELMELNSKMEFLNMLFWGSARREFPQCGAKAIGVRAGWKVVASAADNGDSPTIGLVIESRPPAPPESSFASRPQKRPPRDN